MSAQPILDVRGATKKFGGVTAVNNVSLRVMPGEIVSLIGGGGRKGHGAVWAREFGKVGV